jgi:subtilisin family serine protease
MKKYIVLLIISLLWMRVYAQTPYFYYYNGERQYLELDTEHVFISTTDSNSIKYQPLRVDIPEGIQSKTKHKRFWAQLSFGEKLSDEQYYSKLSEIKNEGKVVIVAPYFKTMYQDRIGLSNFFLVRLKSLCDTILLKHEIEKDHAVIVYQDEFMPLWFVASITEQSKFNAMETANRLYETGLFQHAVPDLMEDIKPNCANDTCFYQQWGLKNTGQYDDTSGIDIKAYKAWQLSTGNNVIVAVLDQGIDLTHPDLSPNIHPLSFDCESLAVPQVLHGNHGTACAGIIGAVQNNFEGISGVAPDCQIMSVSNSLKINTLSRLRRADGINWAWQNGADIISNSWGASVLYPEIDEAINNAVTQGRGGLGCVVVFASGNNNRATVSYPANLPDVIAVGAISPCGERKSPFSCDGENWGSNYGEELDIVAPGVLIPTTDRQGRVGYNPNSHIHTIYGGNKITSDYSNQDYTVWFTGTSSACPHVAGVAALILSVNPDLTGKQVRDIIEATAQKVRTDLVFLF